MSDRKPRTSITLRGRSVAVVGAGDPSLLEACTTSLSGARTLSVDAGSAPAVCAAWDAGWEEYRGEMRAELSAAQSTGDTVASNRVRSADAALRKQRESLRSRFGC
jgi:hypothetical protein